VCRPINAAGGLKKKRLMQPITFHFFMWTPRTGGEGEASEATSDDTFTYFFKVQRR
jgi:hypothetical protein